MSGNTHDLDGYERLQSEHVPEQNAGSVTAYSYNADDTVNSSTDARGAVAVYGYNSRRLVTSINYSAPPGITPAPALADAVARYNDLDAVSFPNGWQGTLAASDYWDRELSEHCH